MAEPVIVPHPNTIRGPIESQYNALRDAIEEKYVEDQVALRDTYHSDLAANQRSKEAALLAAGLNADGGTPSNYPESADPESATQPTITGTAQVGEVLTAHDGTWTRPATTTRKWVVADADETNAEFIEGEEGETYTPVEADAGRIIQIEVTASNPEGSHTRSSAWTDPVLPLAPENTVLPLITGTEKVGEILTTDDGTWDGDPTLTRQWEREDADGTNRADIVGEQDATYTLVEADEGKKIRVTITGRNDGGEDTVQSAWTGVIAAAGGG